MVFFDIFGVPSANVSQILGKMPFREASRMRQTCNLMDDFIRKNTEGMAFPAPEDVMPLIVVRVDISGKVRLECSIFRHVIENRYHEEPNRFQSTSTRSLESGLFRSLTIGVTGKEGSPEPRVADLTSLLRYTKMKCSLLKFFLIDTFASLNPVFFIKLFHPERVYFYGPKQMTALPSSFDSSLRQPVTMGCKQIEVELCDGVPSNYVQIFSQYESVQINSIESETMPSLAPLIQHLIAAPNPTLRYFRLPVYRRETFLSQNEMNELDLGKWRIQQAGNTEDRTFVVDTSDAFITLTECPVEGKLLCSGRRTSKKDIGVVVTQWVKDFFPKVAYDASALYEYVAAHVDNYQMIKKYLEAAIIEAHSFEPTEMYRRLNR